MSETIVETASLFRPLHEELMSLLRGLTAEQWRMSATPQWAVRDVVAHMLDVDLRRISTVRDAHAPPPPEQPIRDYDSLLTYLNSLNAEWVCAARRVSPELLIELIAVTGPTMATLMENADPQADATFPVAWAGHGARSPMWLDIGREYTERWHHQDQIREAVGARAIESRGLLHPVIAISLFALPHAYRDVSATSGTSVALHVGGEAGGEWTLTRADSGWTIAGETATTAHCHVHVPALVLGRLLMHRLSRHDIESSMRVEGDAALAEPLTRARAVMVNAPAT